MSESSTTDNKINDLTLLECILHLFDTFTCKYLYDNHRLGGYPRQENDEPQKLKRAKVQEAHEPKQVKEL